MMFGVFFILCYFYLFFIFFLNIIVYNFNEKELQTLSFNILSKLCSRSLVNQTRFKQKKGISLLLSLLRNPIVLRSERMALFTLALLDCLWHSVLNSSKNESFFLENEGFYVILDFVDYCHPMHRKLALSILAVLIGRFYLFFEVHICINLWVFLLLIFIFV